MLLEPSFLEKPSKKDFYYDGGDDEKYALSCFYGKDIEFIFQSCKNSIPIAIYDTFYFVGTKAFIYYIFGAFRYLQEAVESNDKQMLFESSDTLSLVLKLIKKHIQHDKQAMSLIFDYLEEFAKWVVEFYHCFDIDESIYGDLKQEWLELLEYINNQK